MLGVTLNESEIIDNALKGNYDRDKIVIVINLLIKYYYKQGAEDKLILSEKILDFLKKYYKNYKRAKWEATINKKVSKYLNLVKRKKINVQIIDIQQIGITKEELKVISSLDDIKLEKIAFIMLVYAKISTVIIETNEGWINTSYNMICKEAKVNLPNIEKLKLFNALYKEGYIQQQKKNNKTNIKVCYINNDSDIEIVINDFEGVIYQYLMWKGERWKQCEECGKWIKIHKDSNKIKHCSKCAKEVLQQQWRENKRKQRKKE